MQARTVVLLLSLLLLLGTEARARADDGDQDRGWAVGVALGGGVLHADCDDCSYRGGALGVHVGNLLTRVLALTLEGWAMSTFRGEKELSRTVVDRLQLVAMLGLRYWLVPRLWVAGAAGAAQRFATVDGEDESSTGAAADAGVGADLIQGSHSTLDVRLRASAAAYSDARVYTATLAIGLSWH
jgi:hypothetical protein